MEEKVLIERILSHIDNIKNYDIFEYINSFDFQFEFQSGLQSAIHFAKQRIEDFEYEFKERSNLYSIEGLEIILDKVNKFNLLIENQSIQAYRDLNAFQNEMMEFINKYIDFSIEISNLHMQTYDENRDLNIKELKLIINEINTKNSEDLFDYQTLEETNDINSKYFNELGQNLLKLHNLLLNSNKNNNNIELANTRSLIKHIFILIELDNKNKQEEKQRIEQAKIYAQRLENFALEDTSSLQKGYENETDILNNKIKTLNKFIISIFIIIILLIGYKYIYLISNKPEYLNIYESFVFFAFLLSFSALLGYFLKERKRLIHLHDKYKFISLRLESLPHYMREFNKEQRQSIYIDLSKVFFENNIEKNFKDDEDENINNYSSLITELNKFIDAIKSKT